MSDEFIATAVLALLYILAMYGWGSLFLKLLPSVRARFWDDLASRLVAGCGILYAAFIALSTGGELHRFPVGIVLGAGAIASCFFLPSFVKSAVSQQENEPWNMTDRIFAASIGILVLFQLVLAMTPLIFYDLQVYHLLAPAQFLKSGNLAQIPWNVLTNSPLALQLIVGMTLVLDNSGQLAKFLFAILGCLLVAGTYELIRPAGRRAALLAALFVVCYPEFWIVQTLGAIDIAIAGLMVFGTCWTIQAVRGGQWRPAILAGIAFGMAIGSRYQAVILTALTLTVVLAEHQIHVGHKLPDHRTILKFMVIGVLLTVLLCPWLIRNFVQTGNPFYPLMQGILGGSDWSGDQAARFSADALGPPLSALPTNQKLLSPVMALVPFRSNGLFGIASLFGIPLALLSKKREIRCIVVIGVCGLVIWGLIRPTAGDALLRYNAVSIVFLLAATGAVLGSEKIPGSFGSGLASALAGASFIVALMYVQTVFPAAQSLMNRQLRQGLQQANIPSWAALDYVNDHLDPAHDKILVIGETRGFWLQIPNITPSAFNGPQLDAVFGGNSTQKTWEQSLQRLGITHVLVSFPEFQRLHERYNYLHLPPGQMEAFNRWLQGLSRVFEDGRGTIVLALKNSPGPSSPAASHQ